MNPLGSFTVALLVVLGLGLAATTLSTGRVVALPGALLVLVAAAVWRRAEAEPGRARWPLAAMGLVLLGFLWVALLAG